MNTGTQRAGQGRLGGDGQPQGQSSSLDLYINLSIHLSIGIYECEDTAGTLQFSRVPSLFEWSLLVTEWPRRELAEFARERRSDVQD